jgi:hypothetical protein
MQIARRVDALPEVASSRSDRAFPHTLRVWIVRERPVAVARRGAESWLVSARGRVVARLRRGGRPALPRIWLTRRTDVALGAHLADPDALASVRAAAMLERTGFPVRVASVDATGGQLLFQLRSGIELRLGAPSDLELKLVIARQIVGGIAAPGYLDVSVPERPVSSPDSQVVTRG